MAAGVVVATGVDEEVVGVGVAVATVGDKVLAPVAGSGVVDVAGVVEEGVAAAAKEGVPKKEEKVIFPQNILPQVLQ